MHVLLIEDCFTDQEIVRNCMEDSLPSAKLTVRNDCRDLLTVLNSSAVDIILLDYNLPTATGLGVLNAFKNKAQNRYPPVIMLTGAGDETVAVEAMKLGASDYIRKNDLAPSLLLDRINAALDSHALAKQLKAYSDSLVRLSTVDVQTGLKNRAAFEDRLEHLIDSAERYGRRFTLVLLEVTQQASEHPDATSDETILEISRRVRCATRRCDLLFRLGTNKFAVLAESKGTSKEMAHIAQRTMSAVCTPASTQRTDIVLSLAIGASTFPNTAWDSTGLIRGAERALQLAKTSETGFEIAAERPGGKMPWFRRRTDIA